MVNTNDANRSRIISKLSWVRKWLATFAYYHALFITYRSGTYGHITKKNIYTKMLQCLTANYYAHCTTHVCEVSCQRRIHIRVMLSGHDVVTVSDKYRLHTYLIRIRYSQKPHCRTVYVEWNEEAKSHIISLMYYIAIKWTIKRALGHESLWQHFAGISIYMILLWRYSQIYQGCKL